jgi:hypothetical protein
MKYGLLADIHAHGLLRQTTLYSRGQYARKVVWGLPHRM